MRIEFKFDISRRALLALATVSVVVVVAVFGLRRAEAKIDTSWIQAAKPVTAAAMKAALDEAESRLSSLESPSRTVITKGGKKYSIGATYCGITAPVNGQITNGYAGAKGLCEAVVACGSSPSAHMCTADDMSRSMQMGIANAPGNSWYSTATYWLRNSTDNVSDCNGWNTSAAGHSGALWNGTSPSVDASTTAHPILCCD